MDGTQVRRLHTGEELVFHPMDDTQVRRWHTGEEMVPHSMDGTQVRSGNKGKKKYPRWGVGWLAGWPVYGSRLGSWVQDDLSLTS